MKNYLFSLKQFYKSSPVLITLQLVFTVVPIGVLSGLITNSERNMINSVQNYVLGTVDQKTLLNFVLLFLIFQLVQVVLSQAIMPILSTRRNLNSELYFGRYFNNKYRKIKYEYFEQETAKDLFEKAGEASRWIRINFTETVSIFQMLISIVSSIVALWLVSPLFSGVVFGAGILSFVLNFFRARINLKLYDRYGKERRKIRHYRAIYNENLLKKSQAELRVFGTADKMVDYVTDGVVENEKVRMKMLNKSLVLQYLSSALTRLVGVAVLVYIGVGLALGTLNWPIGNIVVAITGFMGLVVKFSNISYSVTTILENSNKIDFFVNFDALEEEKEGTVNKVPKDTTVVLDHVCFAYPGTERQVLNDVSFNIELGEHIAFVGRNGSGKSTVIKLIMGLYQPTSGAILIGGRPIGEYTYEVKKKLFGIQYQDFYEYQLKVREIVAMGNIDILNKDKKIEKTLEKANVLDAIRSKNATLDTLVGRTFDEDSLELSGGEKQRMSLATTLAFEHDHLILDEPTAALDAAAENKMYEVFMSGIKNKGSLIVSHRLASARISDRIIVFDEGRVVQDGSHEELMQDKNGLYHKMFTAQAKLYRAGEEV